MNAQLVLVLGLAACSSPAARHSLGEARRLKSHLEDRGCTEDSAIGSYSGWFTCVKRILPCGCRTRVTIRASDHDGSANMLIDGVTAEVRGCTQGVGFDEVYDLLDPLFPAPYRGAIHAFIRVPGQPAEGTGGPDLGVIQFAEFPGVSLSAMQRLDPSRPGLEVEVNHYGSPKPARFIAASRSREGCQK